MNQTLWIILSSAFILMSGLLFTLEQLCIYVRGSHLTGTWLADHIISILFLLIGITFLVASFYKRESDYVL